MQTLFQITLIYTCLYLIIFSREFFEILKYSFNWDFKDFKHDEKTYFGESAETKHIKFAGSQTQWLLRSRHRKYHHPCVFR